MATRLSRGWLRIAASLMALAVLAGCNSESELGADFVPVGEIKVFTTRNTAIDQLRDTVITSGLADVFSDFRVVGSPFMLGNYDDPHLGRVNASVFAQFNYSGVYQSQGQSLVDTTFGLGIQVDSVVLSLSINSVYGRLSEPQQLRIRPLLGAIRCSGVSPRFCFPKETDSFAVDGTTDYAAGHIISFAENQRSMRIRLRLPNAVGDSMLSPGFKVTNVCDDTVFNRRFFRGLYFSTDPVMTVPGQFRGAIYTLGAQSSSDVACIALPGLDSINVNVFFRSRDSNVAPNDTIQSRRIVFSLLPTANVGFSRVTRFIRPNSLLDSVLRQPARRNVVLTGGNGYKLRIRLPNLRDSLPDGIVNNASLLLKVDRAYSPQGPDSLRFVPPAELVLIPTQADSTSEGNPSFAVRALYSTVQQGYVVPIGNYVSSVVNGGSDRGILLLVAGRERRPARVVLAGPDHPNPLLRPRLTVFYTPLPR